jgi:hypothetical protein
MVAEAWPQLEPGSSDYKRCYEVVARKLKAAVKWDILAATFGSPAIILLIPWACEANANALVPTTL